MFEKYFVTCPVAVALRGAGFDEPCMACWEHYRPDGTLTTFEEADKFRINYSSEPQDPRMLSQAIRDIMKERPGLFQRLIKNTDLPPYLYAAPLYDQVLEWFMSKGLYLHPFYAPRFEGKIAVEPKYGTNVYNKDLKYLWPEGGMGIFSKGNITLPDRRDAIDQAILAAIKLLPNEQ
jgi:hypothetical protein